MMNIYNPGVRAAMRFGGIGRATFNGLPFPGLESGANYGRSYANRKSPKAEKPKLRQVEPEGYTFHQLPGSLPGVGIFGIAPAGHGAPPDAKPLEPGSPISMRPLKFEFTGVRVSHDGWGGKIICVDFVVPGRKTGQPLSLTYNHAILANLDKHNLAEQTGIAIQKAFEHEVREMLYLGSKQFIDPHPETQGIF